jgi:putative ABC transport system substrate-binding protein
MVSVVVLFAGESETDEPAMRAFFDEMRRRGWVEGTNITYERRDGRGMREYVEGLAKSATSRAPDLIYVTTGSIALAVLKETDAVPLVFVSSSNPVAAGLVASLSRPGGNATGAFRGASDVTQKRVELMREIYPRARQFGVVLDRRSSDAARQETAHLVAARHFGMEMTAVKFTNFEAIAKILANFRRAGIVAVGLVPSFTLLARRHEVGEIAARNRIALFGHRAEWADAGALITYGGDVDDALTRSAGIADRILKGAKPADIPVEQAAGTELIVNRRTAKALGVAIPESILRRAARVIE